jgi:hypothetical protein
MHLKALMGSEVANRSATFLVPLVSAAAMLLHWCSIKNRRG